MQVDIQKLAHEWLRLDQDLVTRSEIEQLLANKDVVTLENRLRKRIAFGTAGLRGRMEAGFSRMNSLTVIQASQGLATYLLDQAPTGDRHWVVIGRDARHNSENFAKLTAAVFLSKGFVVVFLGVVHTPMVPYMVCAQQAAAGVMITASHNPAADNGYKVYWSNGCQIIPPHDRGIAEAIERNLEPETWDTSVVTYDNPNVFGGIQEAERQYFERVHDTAFSSRKYSAGIPFVYTPMHGVGLPFLKRALRQSRLDQDMIVVQAQAEPDPTFPTVKFPNPEEKGALDLAIRVASEHGASLILANDPDADRFAVAESVDGVWRQFTGNQLGVLLASHVLETYGMNGRTASGRRPALLASTVSSRMLSRMAAADGSFHFEETLTGFKWLGNKARELDASGYETLFAYEEAIGYMFPGVVYDKDGVAAATVFLAACHKWKAGGKTPWTKLQDLYEQYGYFEEANTYLVSPSSDATNKIFAAIRASSPTHVGPRKILRWRDLTNGFDTATSDKMPILPVDKSAQMITCELDRDVTVTVRGSGTEPKIKLYIEGVSNTAQAASAAAQTVLEDLIQEWFKPEKNGLVLQQ